MRGIRGMLLRVLAVLTVGTILVYVLGKGSEPPKPTLPPQERQVVVAVRDVPRGTTLTAELLRLKPFPPEQLQAQTYFADVKSLEGRFVCTDLSADVPLVEAQLAPPGAGLECVTRQGKRAMAVKVDAIVGVAGFIKPGHRVDVLVTLRPSEKQADPLTKIVLENIVVLAVGTEVERKGKEREASVVPVITLEVAPEETEKLALAVSQGEVRLALRSVHDERQGTQPVLTAGATIPMLVSSYSSVPPPPPSVRKPKAVEVLKGGHVEVVTVAK